MALGQRRDPLGSMRFFVDIGNVITGSFRECGGLGSETELIESKEALKGGFTVYIKTPGALKWENISLKRGITNSMEIWEWRKEVEQGNVEGARMNGSIIMYDSEGQQSARWNFIRGWPQKVSGPSFNATSNEIGVEELVIVHEGLVRES
ncbi:MAG: phage tail protein [Dehalococcoidia bacterium]